MDSYGQRFGWMFDVSEQDAWFCNETQHAEVVQLNIIEYYV